MAETGRGCEPPLACGRIRVTKTPRPLSLSLSLSPIARHHRRRLRLIVRDAARLWLKMFRLEADLNVVAEACWNKRGRDVEINEQTTE
mgnify:CR=1 FL=1